MSTTNTPPSAAAAAAATSAPKVLQKYPLGKTPVPQWKLDKEASKRKPTPPIQGGSKPSAASASAVSRPAQKSVVVRYCRFEDHQYDRETKNWNKVNGAMRMCPNKDCKFTHRVARPEACRDDLTCTNYDCRLLHSVQRSKPCRFGENCMNNDCRFAHPAVRREPCPQGANCYNYAYDQTSCQLGHPRRMNRICRHDESCRMFECQFLHSDRARPDCPEGSQCQYQRGTHTKEDDLCDYKHPKFTRILTDSNGTNYFS